MARFAMSVPQRTELKGLIKGLLPDRAVDALRRARDVRRIPERIYTAWMLAAAPSSPRHLGAEELAALQERFPFRSEYHYNERSIEVRGEERAAQILRYPEARRSRDFLELASWDGMVSCSLQRRGKRAVAVDRVVEGLDRRATRAGARFFQMDTARLAFPSESFDFVFSYNAFEHFPSPGAALEEAIRVIRPGGCLYLCFGPLYCSPYGCHAFRSVTVPYCQFLFTRDTMNEFTRRKGLAPIDFEYVNGWSACRFRALWRQHSGELKTLRYREFTDLTHMELIRTYPSCFRGEVDRLEELLVTGMEVLFQKHTSQ
jgi:SAM-dependent methyltransferase